MPRNRSIVTKVKRPASVALLLWAPSIKFIRIIRSVAGVSTDCRQKKALGSSGLKMSARYTALGSVSVALKNNHWDAQQIARQSLPQASPNLHFETARRCCAAWREQPDIGVEAGCGRPCFGNILDQLRSDLAGQYLGDGNLSISQ